MAILILTGEAELWMLATSVFLLGVASAFFQPASQGSIVQLVPPELRVAANAVLRLPLNVAKVLGPALGGLVVALVGPGWALAFNASTFLLSVFFLASIRLPQPLKSKASALSAFRTGWNEFSARRWYVIMVAQSTVTVLMWLVGFQLFGPVVSHSSLGGAFAWGLISGGFAFGLVGGSLVAVAVRPRRVGITVSLCLAAQALPLVALAFVAPIWVIVGAAVLAGIALDISIVSWSAFFQEQIPRGFAVTVVLDQYLWAASSCPDWLCTVRVAQRIRQQHRDGEPHVGDSRGRGVAAAPAAFHSAIAAWTARR